MRFAALAAVGALVAGGAGAGAAIVVGAGAWYPLKAVAVFGLVMAAAGTGLRDHPYPRIGLANLVTTVRAMGLALVAGLVGEPAVPPVAWAIVVTTAAMAGLDGLDGWLARRAGMTSAFGARFDMETDALLILALSVLVWQHGKAGPWVLAGGLLRYAFLAAGWVWPWMAGPLKSTLRGKTIAVAYVVGLAVAIAPVVPVPLSGIAVALTLVALGWSFTMDVLWLRGRAALED